MLMEQQQGLWQFDHAAPVADDGGRQHNSHFSFVVGDGFVVLQLPTLHPLPLPREDDIYKLHAKTEGDKLLYQTLDGSWVQLATFEDDCFTDTGNGVKRFFRKITPNELVDWSKGLLKPGRVFEQND